MSVLCRFVFPAFLFCVGFDARAVTGRRPVWVVCRSSGGKTGQATTSKWWAFSARFPWLPYTFPSFNPGRCDNFRVWLLSFALECTGLVRDGSRLSLMRRCRWIWQNVNVRYQSVTADYWHKYEETCITMNVFIKKWAILCKNVNIPIMDWDRFKFLVLL